MIKALRQYFCTFNYNFHIFHIPERLFGVTACMTPYISMWPAWPAGPWWNENILDTLLVSLMRLSYIYTQRHHTTRFVSLPIPLAFTTYHWSITHKQKTYCQSEHHTYQNMETQKHIVSQNITLTKTYKHNHIVCQNNPLHNSYKQQTSCQPEQHTYQNIETRNILSVRTSHLLPKHINPNTYCPSEHITCC